MGPRKMEGVSSFYTFCVVVFCTSFFSSLASAQTVTLTSSVEQDGRQAACPGEVVTFTCMVTEAGGLRWTAEPFIMQRDPVSFTGLTTSGERIDPTAGIHIVLDDISPASDPRLRNFFSTLTVNDSTVLSGTVIQCSNGLLTVNKTFIIGNPPSLPQSPTTRGPVYGLSNFSVAVKWESPASDGGVGIDKYTLTGAGITAPLTVLSNEPLMATLTLSYNEMHMVSITASNCAGESTASVVTIHEVGCGPPTPPPRGSLGDLTSSQEGTVMTFQCNLGLVPAQQNMSVCTNGRWTPDPAELVCRADCGDPSRPVNGDVMVPERTVEGSQIAFQCSPGFVPSQQMISVCAADESWTPDPATITCMTPPPGDCGVPSSPRDGTVNYTTTTVGSRATFQCSAGLVPEEVMTAVCAKSGGVDRWSPGPRHLSCSEPESFPAQGTCTGCTAADLSTAEAVGIAIVLSSIVSFTAGLLVALVIAYCYIRQMNQKNRDPQQPVPMYEDITLEISKDIELKENVAYRVISQ